MKKSTRSWLLIALTAAMLLSSCGGNPPVEESSANPSSDEAAAEEMAPETRYPDDIPEDLQYEGQDVRILIQHQYAKYDLVGENGGDIVFDAVYNRNLKVEERLNVNIEPIICDGAYADATEMVRQSILADTEPYHVYIGQGPQGAALSLEAMLLSTKELPYINMDAPWWNKNYTQNMAINVNDLHYLVGDITMSVFMCSNAVFFNKADFEDRFGNYEEQLYQSVFDGKWTYDVFMNYVEQSYEDTNGNGQTDADDHYGIVYLDYAQDWYISSAGITFMGRDDKGYPVPQIYNENTVKLAEYLQTLFSTPTYGWLFQGEQLDMGNVFKQRHSLFLPGRFTYVDGNLRDMEDPYGVLPYPKVTEDMDYMAASGHSGNFVTVPINNPEPEMTSAVLEAMASESSVSVFPTYYETALKIKYTDGGADAEMIDLVHDCMNFYVTSNVLINGERVGTILQDVVMTNQDFTSYYNANIKKKQALLDTLIKMYEENHSVQP